MSLSLVEHCHSCHSLHLRIRLRSCACPLCSLAHWRSTSRWITHSTVQLAAGTTGTMSTQRHARADARLTHTHTMKMLSSASDKRPHVCIAHAVVWCRLLLMYVCMCMYVASGGSFHSPDRGYGSHTTRTRCSGADTARTTMGGIGAR